MLDPCFSPLRYGDSIVGLSRTTSRSVVLAFQSPSLWGQHCRERAARRTDRSESRFSPLRYGDSIVGCEAEDIHPAVSMFQSPSLWGQHCRISMAGTEVRALTVSVPFAMGTAL